MAGISSEKDGSAALGVSAALISAGAIAAVGLLVIGVLVLSLIPIYTSSQSQPPYGEIYRMSLIVKAIYTNISVNFTGGAVMNTADLSRICTKIVSTWNLDGFHSCLATNFLAYGPSNDTNGLTALRRRRSLDDTSLYETGDIMLIFSNTCGNRRAWGRWYQTLTEGKNSSCVARRATACQRFITTPNQGASTNQWNPFPMGYSQNVITNVTSCAPIAISRMYNVATSAYPQIYFRYNVSRPLLVRFGDCKLETIESQSAIQNLIDTTMNPIVTSTCTNIVGKY